jgi:ring-1,2-phenylacetyl-CoA epoxidase subunit PaaE
MGLHKKLRISAVIKETADCSTFLLEPLEGAGMDYSPGQFLTLVFPKKGGEDRRSYSLSSTPVLGEPLSITVKRVENGAYSRFLLDKAKPGDEILTIGAGGFFTLPEDLNGFRHLFFIAAGSGIAPVFSLIKTALYQYPQAEVVLIYSNRTVAATIFHEQLKALGQKFKDRLRIEWLFSTSPNLAKARLGKWLLEQLVKEYGRTPLRETLFYICGPFDYMRMATIQLLQEGIPAGHIRKEYFETLRQDLRLEPPDKSPHVARLHINGNTHKVQVVYPLTILQAARKEGIALPYSCESGRCGSCAATCRSGSVWMRYNEVLLDDEIAAGRVLTCVGYPVGGDVVLEY